MPNALSGEPLSPLFLIIPRAVRLCRRTVAISFGDDRPASMMPIAAQAGQAGRQFAMTKVLIVEDEPIVAEAMSQFLENAGHEVVGIARDEVSAVCEAAAERPDLVLMDIRLAGASDGIETARKIQAEHPVDVVFVTAHGDPTTRIRAAEAQPAGFVTKPYSARQLLQAVNAAGTHRK
jgi:CheY-like chemotaxis protein